MATYSNRVDVVSGTWVLLSSTTLLNPVLTRLIAVHALLPKV